MEKPRELFGLSALTLEEMYASGEVAGYGGKALCQYEPELRAQKPLKRDAFVKGFTKGCLRKLREIRLGNRRAGEC